MTIAERADYAPASHQQQAVQEMDKAWGAAVEKARSAAWDTFGAAHYPFQDPKGALQAIGDFALDQAKNAWDEIRETFGAGRTWWNEITDITHTPCEDKWNVIITLALPAAADALYLLLTPSPEEILENYLQPYPSKTARRGSKDDRPKDRKKSRSGKTRKSWGGIPDVDNWAAAMIPGAAIVKGRPHGAPTRWIFDGIDRLDRVLWWFLVLEATEQFFTSWTSGMMEARFCSQQWDHLVIGTGINTSNNNVQPSAAGAIWSWSVIKQANVQPARAVFINTIGAAVYAAGTLTGSSTIDVKYIESGQGITLRMQFNITPHAGVASTYYGPWINLFTPGTHVISHSIAMPPCTSATMTLGQQPGGGTIVLNSAKHELTIFAQTE